MYGTPVYEEQPLYGNVKGGTMWCACGWQFSESQEIGAELARSGSILEAQLKQVNPHVEAHPVAHHTPHDLCTTTCLYAERTIAYLAMQRGLLNTPNPGVH